MKLKLDLHTHCCEATGLVSHPDIDLVREIIAAIKARGLDGIAITEHEDKEYGYRVKEIVERYLSNEVLIIPGQEKVVAEMGWAEVVELYLPDGGTFRFLAHPCNPYPGESTPGIDSLHGIEIGNALHDRQLDKKKIMTIAEHYDLLLLQNSDAHCLSDIGSLYNEIDFEELSARAARQRSGNS